MELDDRGTSLSATWQLARRRRRTVVRSLLLSAVVFALSALTGAALASAAPLAATEQPPAGVATRSILYEGGELDFARSMMITGTAALALSVTGMVMVGRRRRCW